MNKAVRLKNQAGFSLIELMIVVAIIGILATIAIPNFQKFQAKARQSEAKSVLSGLYTAEKVFFSEWGQYYGDFRAIGYCPEGQLRFRHGFGAAGAVVTPGAWVTGTANIANGAAPAQFNTTAAVDGCSFSEITVPVAPGTLTAGNTVTSATTFIAEARGDIDGDADVDVWTIDEQKQFTNATTDL